MLKSMAELDISPEVGKGILQEIKARSASLKLSEKAYRVAQGLDSVAELTEYWSTAFEKDDHKIEEDPLSIVTTDLENILDQSYKDQGLRWRLDCLNKSLGSLRIGQGYSPSQCGGR